jgi:hypothetical protein
MLFALTWCSRYRDHRSRPSPTVMRILRKFPALLIAPLLLLATGSSAAPAKELDGNYQCVRLEFQGQSAPCQSPPLVLNKDGSYEIWGEHGTYEVVQGRWLVLSHSKRRGLGHFLDSHEIVFEYRVGSRVCRVTFRRVFEAPPGYRWG